MIEDASVWTKLLTEYGNAEHKKAWVQRKAALQEIVEAHPESRWADDAALILACGKASFEDDARGAISDLEAVIKKYPYAQTVVEQWSPDTGCRFDETWLMWAGGLAMLGPDGLAITSRAFGAHGEIVFVEREVLAYFEQLDICPRSTKVMAQLLISQIHAYAGGRDSAASVLEEIVDSSFAYTGLISAADRAAASQDDGYYVRTLVNRPEYRAFLLLIDYYQQQGKLRRVAELASRWVELCSPDGWLWSIHRHLGNSFAHHGMSDEAQEQYRLALAGLDLFQRDMERRRRFVDGSDIPEDFWHITREDLKRKLKG
jgi:tetratricopeptide (TPR) repeat protein